MVLLQRLDGTKIDLKEDAGIRTKSLIIPSPDIINETDTVEGASGVIDYGSQIGPRIITAEFRIMVKNFDSFSLARDEAFELLSSTEPFYLIEKRMKGKRWLVRSHDSFSIPQTAITGHFTVQFLAVKGYAESEMTSRELQTRRIQFPDEAWSFGLGLKVTQSEDEFKYTFDNVLVGTRFRVYNAGNLPVHPFEANLWMRVRNVYGSTEMFQITNHTNGSRARIERPLVSTDNYIYDGPNITRNSANGTRDTRKDFVFLSPGWNEFEIYYCDRATIEFDFNFLYK